MTKPLFPIVPRDKTFHKMKADVRAFAHTEWGMVGLADILDAATEMVLVHGLSLVHGGHLLAHVLAHVRSTCLECIPRREELFARERACRMYNVLNNRAAVEHCAGNDIVLALIAHATRTVPGVTAQDMWWVYRVIREHGTIEIAANKPLDRIGRYGKAPSGTAVELARTAAKIEYDGTLVVNIDHIPGRRACTNALTPDPELIALEEASGLKASGTVTGRFSSGGNVMSVTKPGNIIREKLAAKQLYEVATFNYPAYTPGAPLRPVHTMPFSVEEFEVGHIIGSFGLTKDHPGFKEPRRPEPEDKSTGRRYEAQIATTDTPEGRDRKERFTRLLKTLPEQIGDREAWDLFSRRAMEIKLRVSRDSRDEQIGVYFGDDLDIPAYRLNAQFSIDCLGVEDRQTAWALLRAHILALP